MDQACEQNDPEIVASAYATGWNANVCDEFVKLYAAAKKSAVSFSFSWSREFHPSADLMRGRNFIVSRPKIEILQDAADRLSEREEEKVETVVGRVVELKAENFEKLIAQEGEVVVRWKSDELGSVKIHMILPSDSYRQAIHAHDRGSFVEAVGNLEKKGRTWTLSNIESFIVLV